MVSAIDSGPIERIAAMCRQRSEYPLRMSVLATAKQPPSAETIAMVSRVLTIVTSELDRAIDEAGERWRTENPIVNLPPTGMPLAMIERQVLLSALKMTGGHQAKASKLLGISPRVFNYKMRVLGIQRPLVSTRI